MEKFSVMVGQMYGNQQFAEATAIIRLRSALASHVRGG
jgi:hypothetical protein